MTVAKLERTYPTAIKVDACLPDNLRDPFDLKDWSYLDPKHSKVSAESPSP
jgi:hypothetical protein